MNKADKQRFAALNDIGCIVCHNLGYGYSPPEIHHWTTRRRIVRNGQKHLKEAG